MSNLMSKEGSIEGICANCIDHERTNGVRRPGQLYDRGVKRKDRIVVESFDCVNRAGFLGQPDRLLKR